MIVGYKIGAKNTKTGATAVAYKIYDVPAFFQYSHIFGQMVNLPNALLSSGSEIDNSRTPNRQNMRATTNNQIMKECILERIQRIENASNRKNPQPISKVLNIEPTEHHHGIAEECGIELTDRTRRTMLKNMEIYLEELKKQKKIKSFKEEKILRKVIGYSVEVYTKQHKPQEKPKK